MNKIASDMTLTMKDNSGDPYRASVKRQHIDVMERGLGLRSPTPSEEFLDGKSIPLVPDPLYSYDDQPQTFTQSLIKGNTREGSLSEIARPDKSYAGPKVNAKSMMRDASKVITDGAKVSRQASLGKEQTKEKMAEFQQDWKDMKKEGLNSFMQAAEENGVNPLSAADQMIDDRVPGKGAAMMYVAAELAVGGGTFATMGKAYFLGGELSKEDKKLSPEKQKSILEDGLKIAQASQNSPVERDTRSTVSAAVEAIDTPKTSDVEWDNFSIEDYAELLNSDPDGMDQPEMQALMLIDHELDEVLENHGYVQNNYANFVSDEKMFAHADAGNSAMAGLIDEAQIIVGPVSAGVLLDRDASNASLAGDGLASVSGIKLADTNSFDSSSVAKILDSSLVNVHAVQRQLDADIHNQFSAGAF